MSEKRDDEHLKQVAKFDQASAFLGSSLPAFWYTLYQNNINEGFTAEQSLDLVKVYIISQGNGDKKVVNG